MGAGFSTPAQVIKRVTKWDDECKQRYKLKYKEETCGSRQFVVISGVSRCLSVRNLLSCEDGTVHVEVQLKNKLICIGDVAVPSVISGTVGGDVLKKLELSIEGFESEIRSRARSVLCAILGAICSDNTMRVLAVRLTVSLDGDWLSFRLDGLGTVFGYELLAAVSAGACPSESIIDMHNRCVLIRARYVRKKRKRGSDSD
jgi:hypothetical protein